MNLRKLEQEENGKTRRLWETIFPEDTKEFLDYYYYVKARENQIYVVEEDGDIRSMLHLNPYRIRIGANVFPSYYIVAVATQEEYRSRGYMGALLHRVMQEMYGKKVPFAFLMPAAEAIYTPYDFRFIYSQATGIVEPGTENKSAGVSCSDAMIWEAGQLADFFEKNFSGRWQIYAERSDEYYRTMILEQQSERGGVKILRDGGKIAGMFAYADEGEPEVREPLYLPEYEEAFAAAVQTMQKNNSKPVRIYGAPPAFCTGHRPVIMARLIRIETFLAALETDEEKELNCSFAVIDPVVTQNSRIWRLRSEPGEKKIHVRETEDSEGVIPVAELTEFLFGGTPAEEIKKRQGVILSDHLESEMKKIIKPERVFLNEIV